MTAPELIEEVGALGFRIDLTADGRPQLVKVWAKTYPPPEVLDALKANRDAVIEQLSQCEVCGRCVVSDEDRERMSDPAFCEQGGARAVKDKTGKVIQLAVPRCPYKEPVEEWR